MKPYPLNRFQIYLLFIIGTLLLVPASPVTQAQSNSTRGTIIVAVAANGPPFAAQADNGQLVGFDLDIMQTLARTAGLQINYEAVPFVQLIPGVATRLYDAALGCIAINDARRALVDFTASYFTSGFVLVFPEGDAPLYALSDLTAEMVVATLVGSVVEVYLEEQSEAEVLALGSEQAVLDALSSGVADAALIDEITATQFIRSHPEAHLRTVSGLLTSYQCGIVVSKENPRLLLELNAALTRMKNNGRYLTIYRRWFGTRPLNGPSPAARPTPPTTGGEGTGAAVTPIGTATLDPLVESVIGLYALTLATEPSTYQLLELAPDRAWLESIVVPEAETLQGLQTLTTGAIQVQAGTWQSVRTDPIAITVDISATVPLSVTMQTSGPVDGETGDGETGDGETGDGEIAEGETGDGEIAEGEIEVDGNLSASVIQPYKTYQLTVKDDGSLRGSYTLYATAIPTTSLVITETVDFVGRRVLQ